MEAERPDPDQLLTQVMAEEARAKRGKQALYDQGYAVADLKASTHGDRLETFKEIKA